jgi:hypothetical protein
MPDYSTDMSMYLDVHEITTFHYVYEPWMPRIPEYVLVKTDPRVFFYFAALFEEYTNTCTGVDIALIVREYCCDIRTMFKRVKRPPASAIAVKVYGINALFQFSKMEQHEYSMYCYDSIKIEEWTHT